MSPRKTFRVVKPLLDTAPILPSAAHITRADLARPCCHVCFTPIGVGEYCSRHLADGSAARHRSDPARRTRPA